MSDSPFIDGEAPKPGGEASKRAAKEWESKEKPKQTMKIVGILALVLLGAGSMAALMAWTAGEPEGEAVEGPADKSMWLTVTNDTDALSWLECTIGDPDDGGQQYKKKISPKSEGLVELGALPADCIAKDEKGTVYWEWKGDKKGTPEEGLRATITRKDPPPAEEPPAEEGAEEGAEAPADAG